MGNLVYLIVPFVIQGLLMFFDEFYFHHKRGLPKWEVIGHPIDTVTVLLALLIPVCFSPTELNQNIYLAFSGLSCLVITKDEWVHKDLCSHAEMWLHALLFVLHPILFYCVYALWQIGGGEIKTDYFIVDSWLIIVGQFVFTASFLTYQVIYWGFYVPKKSHQ